MPAIDRRLTVFAASLAAALCASSTVQALNVYSSRHYDSDDQLYDAFTAETGIEVNRIEGEAEELIARMTAEGANSPADILLTTDAGRIWLADSQGLLQPVASEVLTARIPEFLRHPDGHWFGVSQRARIIFYAKDRVETPPMTYLDLADPEWAERICIRTSSNVYNLSLMGAMIAHHGEAAARDWAAGLRDNLARPPEGGDTDQLKGLVSGACDIAVANTYYFARALAEQVEGLSGQTDAIGWVFPDQDGAGTHVNVTAAGVAANAPNVDEAVAFLEYLTTDEAQAYFAGQNHEFPVVDGVPASDAAAGLGDFTRDEINLSVLGENQPQAQAIFNEVGLP